MTFQELKVLRASIRNMTADELRAAHAGAVHTFAFATTQDEAQRAHDMAGEYAEGFQRLRSVA